MQNRIGIQCYKMSWGWMVRGFARNSLSNKKKKKKHFPQASAKYMTAVKACDEHYTGILGRVLCTLIPDMHA